MERILVQDLEVFYRVGVPEEERAQVQRLLITVEMEHDFSAAAAADDLHRTIDYFQVAQRLLGLGENRSWRLIETLAVEIAEGVLGEFGPGRVRVQVKKFIIPQAAFVAVEVVRP